MRFLKAFANRFIHLLQEPLRAAELWKLVSHMGFGYVGEASVVRETWPQNGPPAVSRSQWPVVHKTKVALT